MKSTQGTSIGATEDALEASIDEKLQKNEIDSENEKGFSEEDVEVVIVDEDGDVIRESGMLWYTFQLRTIWLTHRLMYRLHSRRV